MKIDLYTKAVLTVIAVALAAIVLRDVPLMADVHAAEDAEDAVVRVEIVGISKELRSKRILLPVEIQSVANSRMEKWDTINVGTGRQPLDVRVSTR